MLVDHSLPQGSSERNKLTAEKQRVCS